MNSGVKRLAGRTALITGAGSGIGLATALRFQEEGASVVATDVFEDIRCGHRSAVLDVTDARAVSEAVREAISINGRLDIVVNAAGIMIEDDVGAIDDDVWERVIAVNLQGTMSVCRAVIPHMQTNRSGSIVNVASVAAFNASAGMASYAASKAGVVAMTRAIANRYGIEGVRANCVAPGWVRTAMSEREMADAARSSGRSVEDEFAIRAQRIALGRIASASEIAACIAFLASDDASFVTGSVLVADGGARTSTSSRAH